MYMDVLKKISNLKFRLSTLLLIVVVSSALSVFIARLVDTNRTKDNEPDQTQTSEQTDEVTPAPSVPPSQSFSGVLPCADCSGIHTELTLQKDPEDPTEGVYVLKQTYVGKSTSPQTSLGKWNVVRGTTKNSEAIVLELKSGKALFEYWLVVDNDTLQMLDLQKNQIQSSVNLQLKRKE